VIPEQPPSRPGPDRRTSQASERTQLAWWRTGLTAIAVALGVGRVLPDLADSGSRWSYTVVGIGFAVYGIAMIAYGTRRARSVAADLGLPPAYQGSDRARFALAAAGIVLGAAAALLILVD
jgi:putative membrane protein